MALTDTLRRWFGAKSLALPQRRSWQTWSYLDATPAYDRLEAEGYRKNAAVFACVRALVFYGQQPRFVVRDAPGGDVLPDHPLQRLLDRPNPSMSQREWSAYTHAYRAVGGNAYAHKVRGRDGRTIELWPYHAGQIQPEPGGVGNDWIARYWFGKGTQDERALDPAQVVHFKWPVPNLQAPWLAQAPLEIISAEVGTDSEATRYLYALLVNDATPRTVLNVKTTLTDQQFMRLQQQFAARHGGDRRGGVGVVEGDAAITRLSLNLQELAFDALRRVPEARIAAAFGVPAMLAGLNVGLERSTYSNYAEARRMFIEDTVMQLVSLDAAELTADLGAEYGVVVEPDYSAVVGLSENENDKYERTLAAFDGLLITRNEARKLLGLPPIDELGIPELADTGNVLKQSAPPVAPPSLPNVIDVLPVDAPKARRDLALKILKQTATDTPEQVLQRETARLLGRMYRAAATSVREGDA